MNAKIVGSYVAALLLSVTSNLLHAQKADGYECSEGAASFDCTKAKTTIEKAICGNKSLAENDCKLGYVYRESVSVSKELRQEQRQWIKERDASCEKKSPAELANCLSGFTVDRAQMLIKTYKVKNRLYDLDDFKATKSPTSPTTGAGSPSSQPQQQQQVQLKQQPIQKSDTASADTRTKGLQFAKDSGVKWQLLEKKDEMTGTKAIFARLESQSSGGARIATETICNKPNLTLKFTIIKGDVPVERHPNFRSALVANVRLKINEKLTDDVIIQDGAYRNLFYFASGNIVKGRLESLARDVFKAEQIEPETPIYAVMVEIPTNMGAVLVKIPPFDTAVDSVINSCK